MITSIENGRAVTRIRHAITEPEAAVITRVLAAEGIRLSVEWDINGVLHLWAPTTASTKAETRALRAFLAVGDGPVEFHRAVSRA